MDKLFNSLVCRYFHRKPESNAFDYITSIKPLGTFHSIEEFWKLYCHMKRLSTLPPITDVHMFKEGIKPVWEDERNTKGGKWILHLRKGLADRIWEKMLLALIGNQFSPNLGLCGTVISMRVSEDIVSLWNDSSSDQKKTTMIREAIMEILDLPLNCILEYKATKYSVADNSSFRNTDIFYKKLPELTN